MAYFKNSYLVVWLISLKDFAYSDQKHLATLNLWPTGQTAAALFCSLAVITQVPMHIVAECLERASWANSVKLSGGGPLFLL